VITLAATFCGKEYAIQPWLEAFRRLEVPRRSVHLLLVSVQATAVIDEALKAELARCQSEWASARLITAEQLALRHVPQPQFTNKGANAIPRRKAIAETCRLVEDLREPGTDLFIWQDDIIPAPNAYLKVMAAADADPDAWIVGAVQPDRGGGICILAWEWLEKAVFGPGDSSGENQAVLVQIPRSRHYDRGPQRVAAVATGFVLYRNAMLEQYRFRSDDDYGGEDLAAGYDLRKFWPQKRCVVVWDARTGHMDQRGKLWTYTPTVSAGKNATAKIAGGRAVHLAAKDFGKPLPENQVAIVAVAYGRKAPWQDAARGALSRWKDQDFHPLVSFAEGVWPGEEPVVLPALADYPQLVSTVVPWSDQCQLYGAGNKEPMFNLAAKAAVEKGAKVIAFVDADVWSEDRTWFRQIAASLTPKNRQDVVLQCFRRFRDPEIAENPITGIAASEDWPAPSRVRAKYYYNPGIAWAVTADYWKRIGGANGWCVPGNGDVMWLWETVGGLGYIGNRADLEWMRRLKRDVPMGKADYLDVDLVHESHGPITNRGYRTTRRVVDWAGDPARIVRKRPDGILEWRHPSHALREMFRRREEMPDFHEMYDLAGRVGLHQHFWGQVPGFFRWPEYDGELIANAPDNATMVWLGCLFGKEMAYVAVQAANERRGLKIVCTDLFPKLPRTSELYTRYGMPWTHDGDMWKAYVSHMAKGNALHLLTTCRRDAAQLSEQFWLKSVYSLFVDACHTEEGTRRQLKAWLPKMADGGVMCGDDYANANYPGVKKVVDEMFGNRVRTYPIQGLRHLIWEVRV